MSDTIYWADRLTSFNKRLHKCGVRTGLVANYPWIYLDSVNDKKVTEKFLSNHGFTIMFVSGVRKTQTKFTDLKEIFKIIRKYRDETTS